MKKVILPGRFSPFISQSCVVTQAVLLGVSSVFMAHGWTSSESSVNLVRPPPRPCIVLETCVGISPLIFACYMYRSSKRSTSSVYVLKLERWIGVVWSQYECDEGLGHRESRVVVDAECPRDLLVHQVRAAIQLGAHMLCCVKGCRLGSLACNARSVAGRKVQRRKHEHVAVRVPRAQQCVELDRGGLMPRWNGKNDSRPHLHRATDTLDIYRRLAQELLRQKGAVVQVV
jgi:hypothetical protein